MLLFTILFITSASVTCLVKTEEAFIAFRCFSAGCAIASYISSFTYAIEVCPKESRTTVAFLIQTSQTLSHITTPLFGFIFRQWRVVGLAGSLLSVPFLFLYPIIPESPRWLLSRSRLNEAKQVCQRFAKSNNVKLQESDWDELMSVEVKKNKHNVKYSVLDLFKRKRCRFLSFMIFLTWCMNYLIFYGMVLNIKNFFGNVYINSSINAAIEMCGNFFGLLDSNFERRNLLVVSFFSAGLACIASNLCETFSNGNINIMYLSVGFALFGKMNSQINNITLYSTTTEVYPTLARGTGLSFGSISARFGCLLAPLIVQLQSTTPWITQASFALAAFIGSFAAVFFPACKNITLFMTLEAAEDFYRERMVAYNKIFGIEKNQKEEEAKPEELQLTASI